MIRKNFKLLLVAVLAACVGCSKSVLIQKDLAIVPYPKEISVYQENFTLDASQIGVNAKTGAERLSEVIKNDIYRLTGIKPADNAPAVVNLSISKSLEPEEYKLTIKNGKINITGGSYSAVAMGWSTVLQAADITPGKLALNNMTVQDKPDLEYRGLLLDLARQFHHKQNVKDIIDLCRWNKINYMQLHLNDDSRNVFPTKILPKTLKEGEYYTEEEMRDIIQYADDRGVTLVPEIEGPGHSTILREAYPEIFGEKELRTVNLANDKAIETMKRFNKEVIDMFASSPYFHIGADEVNLDIIKEKPDAIAKIKESGYDDIHDLYLDYVVKMHDFVKSEGKQTLVWEGFDHDGSAKVKIPKDIIVMAFETVYQRPDSLAKGGYRIINTSWKPIYIVPNRRWPVEKIYNWNHYTWENWWDIAPATKEPIVLDENDRKMIMGTQMCAWEMNEYMEYTALCKRLAALGEISWNTLKSVGYPVFEQRMDKSEAKLNNLIYPFEISGDNFTDRDYKGPYYNWENFFAAPLTLAVKSNIPDATLRYTTDRSFPGPNAPVLPENLTIDKDTFMKIAQYGPDGKLLAYYPVFYNHKPVKVEFIGEGNNDNNQSQEVTFFNNIKVRLTTPLKEGTIRYTLDGKPPYEKGNGIIYTDEINMDQGFQLRVQYYDANDEPQGNSYHFWVMKR